MTQTAIIPDGAKPVATTPAPSSRKTPVRVRCKLASATDCHREAAAIYRLWKSGLLDSQELSRAANVLSIIARIVTDSELEQRLEALEKSIAVRSSQARVGMQ